MKSREARRAVMISARMRHGSGWSDARILNISSRGLLVQAQAAPQRGTYVEICRGQYRIVARVVWAQQDRFGVCSQDLLPVTAISAGIEPPAASAAQESSERRSAPRPSPVTSDRYALSRQQSRAFEFLCVVGFGVGAAALAFDAIRETLQRPLAMVSAELAPGT